jgi:hypothetical protein
VKLTPIEILHCLGFDVPPDGILVNRNDAFIHAESLRLLGKTMNVSSIPDSELRNIYTESIRLFEEVIDVSVMHQQDLSNYHSGFADLIKILKSKASNSSYQPSEDIADWLRALIRLNIDTVYRLPRDKKILNEAINSCEYEWS